MRLALSLAAALAFAASALAQPKQPKLPNLPPNLLAPTDPLSPEDERKQFVVPPGFEVQLIASEPDIQKPMQMAFDPKGRMWVTTSYHYPFATDGKPTDKVFVLSDFDPKTGKAKKVQTFTSDLNIPIGILPLPDCKSVLVSSVGEIRKYKIAEKDGVLKSDGYEVLFSGFGSLDTHGMYNSYTLMPDGWVYSCHGFNNTSTVKDKSGNTIKMHSGNTFRFRPDGSKIEVWTRGQVNPFGMAVDPWFNLYTADCHSKPITQLIPGAYYDSFGKPHDGLGFAPHVTAHPHKSTGLCGLVWYDADHYPKEYLGTMLLGDVVSNCISADRIDWKGASPVAKELPDFMTSKDRWFRPVDIKLGPDGALYVADFYNKIIGHYEVDLRDPRRDKDRGRLWRIVWKGAEGKAAAPTFHRADFTKATDEELLKDMLDPNLTVRFLAGHQLRLRSAEGKDPLANTGEAFAQALKTPERVSAVVAWMCFIAEVGKEPVKLKDYADFFAYAQNPKNVVKPEHVTGHLVRALSSREKWGDGERKILLDVFKSFDSIHQTRACIDAVIAHPHADFVPPVLAVLKKCAPDDTHLRMAAKVALRNCLRDTDAWPAGDDAIFVEMATAIPNEKAAKYLLGRLKAKSIPADKLSASAEHIARYGPAEDGQLYSWLSDVRNPDALAAVVRGVQARGTRMDADLTKTMVHGAGFVLDDDSLTGATPPPAAKVRDALWGLRLYKALTVIGDRDVIKAVRPASVVPLVHAAKAPDELRVGAVEVLLAYDPVEGLKAVRKVLADEAAPEPVRTGVILAAATSNLPGVQTEARDALKTVPYRVAVPVGLGLASTPVGAELLLEAVKQGKAPAQLLQEKAVVERLRAQKIKDFDKVLADLTKNLPAADQRIANLLKARATAFANAKPDKVEGAKLFAKHCAACHRVGDTGGKIAPQLDGIGVRGTERLLEDVLDPNRNVDQAFRARSITLTNDKTLTALMLRVEGKVLVVADLEGKEQRIPLDEIATNRETQLSAMPANLADTIPERDLYHILAYLLDQKAKDKK
ncbi:MAG: c-type cytochrome [Planctomycetes bacterium]|nr:c-type cytochrome [Planctomycetota bacterium]